MPAWRVCELDGVLVADPVLHAAWHAAHPDPEPVPEPDPEPPAEEAP